MGSCQGTEPIRLTETQCNQIKAEVEQVAIDHLNAQDATTALSNYTKDVLAVSNEQLYTSSERLAEDIKVYYSILKQIDFAAWDETHINVINTNTALFTGKFRYSFTFTSTNNEKHAIQGVWTALFIRINDKWKIRVRHESFVPLDAQSP